MARRWEPAVFLVTERLADGTDRIVSLPDFMMLLVRAHQYRLMWDHGRQAWRVDRRSADATDELPDTDE